MSINNIVRILGLLAAVIAAFTAYPYAATVIAILGLVGGYYVGADDRTAYLVLAVALAAVHGAIDGIPGVGMYVTSILGQVSGLVSAGAVTVIVVHIYEELTA
jgi:hypothetical protein